MRHYLLSLAIFLSSSMASMGEDRYCLYWPVYIEGATSLYVADLIDTSDPDPCSDAISTYYWADTDDPYVPENCPDCGHMAFLRSAAPSSTEELKPIDHFAGLSNQFSGKLEFADLVPQKWQRYDAKQGGEYTWNPREGVICQQSRVVTVKTELGEKIRVKLFDIKFSPGRANLLQSSIKSKSMKLGYEVTGVAGSASKAYEPKKMTRHPSSKQGLIQVDGADYTIISKSPLFQEESVQDASQNN